ncbi:copper-binding protein [Luteolibacter arcticus]|uniref:Copper-binding protein n=1 Tax=Luteolibacter arcticus TaxID=1581411 RepID=A0ABT3GHX8_9BACT|nr:copper-binding protein [Luteolibacter arcticus]MCW1923110.1 copper-binding protein [Luteolibacter arcticus]
MSTIRIFFTLPFILKLVTASEKPLIEPGEVRTYDLRGVVEKLRPEVPAAVIRHEEIPGFMEAMSMTLRAKDAREFEGVHPGDGVTFRLHVTRDDGWIDLVKVIEPGQEAVGDDGEDAAQE